MPKRALASLWLPPFALMAVIFLLSAQADLNSGLGIVDTIGRKVVHASEYALLCALWYRALRTAARSRTALLAAVALSVAYAASDEFHQTFVHGRHASPLDVGIDALGVGIAVLWIRRRRERAAGTSDSEERLGAGASGVA